MASSTRQRWLRPPQLRTLDDQGERHATWLELFFDLVFVISIAEVVHTLEDYHSLADFLGVAGLFVAVWWAWVGYTVYADRFDTDDLLHRVLVLGVEGPQLGRSQPPPPRGRRHQPLTYMITGHLSEANSGRPPGIPGRRRGSAARPGGSVVRGPEVREPQGMPRGIGPALEGGRWWAWSRCGRRRRSGSSAPT